ncbi:MAG TPA: DUF885 domain-containing protein [Gemmatimonadales bacterium]|nr:DUF885 domain-containing protein [Gemmatimonadales bacterium]
MRLSLAVIPMLLSGSLVPADLAAAQHQGRFASSRSRPPADTTAQRVNALADEYLKEWLEAFPELPTLFGIPGARHDRLSDRSAAGERAWQRREDRWLAALRTIDGGALLGRPEWVTYGLLREQLEASVGLRACRDRVWTVSPFTGWQAYYATLAQVQPVGAPDLREQAVARWRELPKLIRTEIGNLREGVEAGYSEPKVNVERVIAGLDKLLATADTASPFLRPAARDTSVAFRTAFQRLLRTEIVPALRLYRDYLATDYLPAAREAIAITANPQGAACYRAAIRRFSTLDLSGEEIHQLGLREVAAAESTMTAVAERTYHTTDTPALLRRLRSDTAYRIASRDSVIPLIDSILARAWVAVPRWFGLLPRAKVDVQPVPEFQEPAVPLGRYLPPALDGSRPGIYVVNLYLATRPGARLNLDNLTFHEAVPGHHFQLAIARERQGVHPLTRYLSNSAFVEGWGIYAETMAREMGLYPSDATWLRELEDHVYVASTLVMETGMHVLGWSRQQAIDYELAHTTRSPEQAALDVDRRIGWPGQGLSYVLGYLEILRLRREAEGALGTRFDIKAFHDRMLEDGSITLPMLRQKIEAWVRRQGQL